MFTTGEDTNLLFRSLNLIVPPEIVMFPLKPLLSPVISSVFEPVFVKLPVPEIAFIVSSAIELLNSSEAPLSIWVLPLK